MSDDLAQQSAPSIEAPEAIPIDEPEPLPAAFVQLTEITATPQDAMDAIERRDSLGRIPVVVRIRRQPPIKVEWIVIAMVLAASGLLPPVPLELRVLVFVLAVVAVLIGLVSRLFLRVPPGTVGLVVKGGRHDRVVTEGVHRVNPMVALSHLVSTREIAFDVPVSEVRSSDGVGVSVDLMLGLRVADPVKFAYSVSTGDADQLVHAAAQEAVRTMVRGIEALSALDLGGEQAAILREAIDTKLGTYGIGAHSVSFTRVTLPAAFTSSLEARRLSVVQLAEQSEAYTLERRRLADHASLDRPGGGGPPERRGARRRGRGPAAGQAGGAARREPPCGAVRHGDVPDPDRAAAGRQQPRRGLAGGDGPGRAACWSPGSPRTPMPAR